MRGMRDSCRNEKGITRRVSRPRMPCISSVRLLGLITCKKLGLYFWGGMRGLGDLESCSRRRSLAFQAASKSERVPSWRVSGTISCMGEGGRLVLARLPSGSKAWLREPWSSSTRSGLFHLPRNSRHGSLCPVCLGL